MKLDRRLLELARKLCANHIRTGNYGKTDYCLLEPPPDHKCLFATTEGSRCGYFEESVLPVDAELEALYRADREARAHGDELTKERAAKVVEAVRVEVTCEKCGKPYVRTGRRQRFCPSCRDQVAKERNRARKRRQRGAVA